MSGRLLRFARAIVGAVGLLVIFVVSAYVSFNFYVRRGATSVPELAGLAIEEAERLLADQGLKYRAAEPAGRWSSDVEEGKVLESRPRAGSTVKQGSAVEIVVSLGSRMARVPDLAGKALSAADLTARAEGLELGEALAVYSATAPPGVVVGQAPAAGESAPAGSKVDLLVALGSPGSAYVMPDLIYRRYAPVRRAFDRGGFRFGAIKFEPYEGIADGTILRQTPLPGHPLHRLDVISLVVAGSGVPTP